MKKWSSTNTACNSTATLYAESYIYSSKGLVSSKTITTPAGSYVTGSSYDAYGRPSVFTYLTVGTIPIE